MITLISAYTNQSELYVTYVRTYVPEVGQNILTNPILLLGMPRYNFFVICHDMSYVTTCHMS